MKNIAQKRPLFIAIAVVAIVGAIWFYVFLTTPSQQSLDQRVHDVGAQLKCPICEGESVADSPSTLAQQMRGVIRQQLQAGKSEQEVISYFQARYGANIVWSPQWQGFSLLAWLVPIVLLLGGFVLLFFVLRDWRRAAPQDISMTAEVALPGMNEQELARYRLRLEQELAEEDPLFMQMGNSNNRREAM